ncbi:membrane protein [Streptomyces sparsus]
MRAAAGPKNPRTPWRAAPRRTLGAGLLALTLPLAGCGTEQTVSPAEKPAERRAELRDRAESLGVAYELVHVTEVPGYEIAGQSVGPIGDDGYGAAYVSRTGGAVIRLAVDRDRPQAPHCAREQSAAPKGCERDGEHWYLPGRVQHEYQRPGDGYLLRLTADRTDVDRATLRTAAENARRADAGELDALLPEAPADTGPGGSAPEDAPWGEGHVPTERGDLPPEGDGAPDNDVGVGG